MKAFVITLRGNEYSERKAARCIETASQFGVEVTQFDAVPADEAEQVMQACGLKWTWANDNTSFALCPITKLRQHPYGRLAPKIGCSMSHFLLWGMCVALDETFLILEHDAEFIRPLPNIDFDGICQINDPTGATPKGAYWAEKMIERGKQHAGVHVWPKTKMFANDKPDGLAGNSAYLIKPWAAKELVTKCDQLGLWPNDAVMCRQLFPYLQELYPFVTEVKQEQSTTT